MTFEPTEIPGVLLIKPDLVEDERGFFARTFCAKEFERHGLNTQIAQTSISFNHGRGTLRGMHYQAAPHEEAKLVRVTQGRIFDVAVDLRKESPTFKTWTARELSSENRHALYIPEGCAHGFLTLVDCTEVFYQISSPFAPSAACGFLWSDPVVDIRWPIEPSVLSERDSLLGSFSEAQTCLLR